MEITEMRDWEKAMSEVFDAGYDTVRGLAEPSAAVAWAEDAFTEGAYCSQKYQEMREAYERLCGRLGVENEDPDLNMIVTCLEGIQRELCLKMFHAGVTICMLYETFWKEIGKAMHMEPSDAVTRFGESALQE